MPLRKIWKEEGRERRREGGMGEVRKEIKKEGEKTFRK